MPIRIFIDTDPDPTFHPDADPDPAYHFDADPDPDFYLTHIRMRIRIFFYADADPGLPK
jgi:hypothetical protein